MSNNVQSMGREKEVAQREGIWGWEGEKRICLKVGRGRDTGRREGKAGRGGEGGGEVGERAVVGRRAGGKGGKALRASRVQRCVSSACMPPNSMSTKSGQGRGQPAC